MIAISITHLYKQDKEQMLLEDISLDVHQGEIYGMIGNTSKQLLNRIMLGLVKPTGGQIFYWGKKIKYGDYKHLSRVGVATDDVYFYEELSGFENIQLYLEPYKKRLNRLDTLSMNARINNYFKLFNLVTDKDVIVKKYSLGMRQKLKLIRAFVIEPRFLVLEEPLKALDPVTSQILIRHLKKLSKEKDVAIFITTSMLNSVKDLVDKIGVLHDGRLIEQIDTEELQIHQQAYLSIKSYELPKVLIVLERYLNLFDFEVVDDETVHILENFGASNEIIEGLSKEGIVLEEVKYGSDSLETYFLDKIGG